MRSRDVGQHGIADLLAIRGGENGPDRQWGVEYRLLLYVGKWASLMNSPFYSFPNDLEVKSTIESTSKKLQVAPQNVPQNGHLDSTRIGTANGAIALRDQQPFSIWQTALGLEAYQNVFLMFQVSGLLV